MKTPLIVSCSFGKSSMFMANWLIENKSDIYDLHFLFANTGREMEETLIFGDKCQKHFGINLIWLEADINPKKGIGPRHKIVNFKTASRNGEPFESLIKKEGIPNIKRAMCTDRLKTQVMRSWMRENGFLKRGYCAPTAIGMRADEPKRNNPDSPVAKRYNLVYPLSHWIDGGIDKQDVNDFWEQMPFNLEIEDYQGNCITCFKKSDKKLLRIAKENPEYFSWNSKMEDNYSFINSDGVNPNFFFRGRRNARNICGIAHEIDEKMIIAITKTYGDENSGCSESCDAYSSIIEEDEDY